MKFAVIFERDEDGYCAASVPELSGCHTQSRTLHGLMERVREAIQAYLEAEGVKAREVVELIGFHDGYP